jgi:CRP/FNR family transcriptional regulator
METNSREAMNRSELADCSTDFLTSLSPAALKDIESLGHKVSLPAGAVLFAEQEPSTGVYLIRGGEVKLTINSSDGRRLILRIAKPGEILGLTSALTGNTCEMTAETLFYTQLISIPRQDFLNFLLHHPEVYQTLTQELTRHLNIACEQLRTVGLSTTAPEKLARLFLDWSAGGQKTESGTRLRCSLTHEEIGEFIGTSRETVTRTLTEFKHRHLVAFHGSTLMIPNRVALESLARS